MHPLTAHWAELERRLTGLCTGLEVRLADTWLQDVRDYVDHNEFGLATDILVDHLCDNDVEISQAEYDTVVALYETMRVEADPDLRRRLQCLVGTIGP